MDMRLQRLWVRREEYGQAKGQLSATVEFAGPHGKVELTLDEQMAQEVLHLCADAVTRASRQIADELTAQVLTQTALPPAE